MTIHYDAIAIPQEIKPRKITPGRRIVIIAILISISLFCSQLFSIIGTPRPELVSLSHIYHDRISLNQIREKPSCFKNYLGELPFTKPNRTCNLINPPRGYCSVLQKLFANPPKKCPGKHTKFCIYESGEFRCSIPQECSKKDIFIGTFDDNSMKTTWFQISPENIEVTLNTLRSRPIFKGYFFIACAGSNNTIRGIEDFEQSQLLTVPNDTIPLTRLSSINLPNLNFIMLDSVSRPHFYRSLPMTIKTLEILKSKKRTDVLDYGFLQAITQGTYESIEGLFTGYVNTTKQSDSHLPLGKFLKKLKSKGYQTHWLEDSCWKDKEGLVNYFHIGKNSSEESLLQRLNNYIVRNYIDDAQFSFLSCDILSAIKNRTEQYTPICYNGKYFHEYLLEQVNRIQERNQKSSIPTFTFTHLTVGREYSGTRIQSLDESLSVHLHKLSSFENTVIILFSNHGNTNGMLVETSFEGYIEAFNPFLFVVLPTKVKRYLTQTESRNLIENEQKLISLVDVHGFIMHLVGEEILPVPSDFKKQFVFKKGLISHLPRSRTCYDLPLISPNLCICREFEAHVVPTKLHIVLADFCIGSINNLILRQRFRGRKRGFGACEILMLAGVRVVHERRIAADSVQYKLDVDVFPTGMGHRGAKEIFFFTIEVIDSVPAIRMLSYERLSAYEIYGSCRDPRVNLRLCVCNLPTNERHETFIKPFYFIPDSISALLLGKPTDSSVFNSRVNKFIEHKLPMHGKTITDHKYPKRAPCLFVFRHQYEAGFCIYAFSVCTKLHKIIIGIESNNYQLTMPKISSHLLYFSELKYLVCGISNESSPQTVNYSIDTIPFG